MSNLHVNVDRAGDTWSPEGEATADTSTGRTRLRDAVGGAVGVEAQRARLAPVQRRVGDVQLRADAEAEQVHVAAAHGVSGSGGALPHGETIAQSFGTYDLSNVTAHTDAAAAEGSAAMGAEAYATGSDIAFSGAPDLHTAAHEAAHVVQQRSGVSLSGGVGQAGDSYEQHADRVADAVVAGRSAEPILHEMAGGDAGPAGEVQRQAVQRALSSGTVDAGTEAATTARAAARGGTTITGDMVVRGTNQGEALVARGASSMAENPDFEKDAMAFEFRLGVDAYSRGNRPAGAMAAKGKAYLMEKTGATAWKASEATLATELVKLGSTDARWSGTVGKAVDDLLAVFDSGNVATRMCHLENLWGMLSRDVALDNPGMDAMLTRAGLIAEDLKRFREERGGNQFAVPAGSEVAGQAGTRLENHNPAERRTNQTMGADLRTQDPAAPSAPPSVSGGGPEAGVTLDRAEATVQAPVLPAAGGASPETARLQWEEGARIWMMNERNKWVNLMRQLSMPLAAGPSGTTNKLMNLGMVLGMSPFDTRLACIGYLLPSHHHSLCEIMEAAAPHGASDFIRGREMYTQINPWSQAELKQFGNGKFPHETHGADPVPVPQGAA